MAYTPHTPEDIAEMLQAIGAESIGDLFADVPTDLMLREPLPLEAMNEYDLVRFFECAAAQNLTAEPGKLFLGAGAYRHYIPAAVTSLVQRGEFVTCYTPYQAEVSQGTLQAIFEFQSHICQLTGMEAANASMYDGATALAEALLLAVRHTRRNTVLLPEGLHPRYAAVCRTFLEPLGVVILTAPLAEGGGTDFAAASVPDESDLAAVVVQTPDFLGVLQDPEHARELAERSGALLVGVCNPTALALIEPPGAWGADIAVGEAQPLGIPLQYGGPYCGYFACREKLIRKMPGRVVGRTTDDKGRPGFVLTLQTREQHIRREKATSNICTNQGLFALMVTLYLTCVGQEGLVEVAETSMARTHALADTLVSETAAEFLFPEAPYFHEAAIRLPVPAAEFVARMREEHEIVAGLDLGRVRDDWRDVLLVCATETNRADDIRHYLRAARTILGSPLAAKVTANGHH